MSEANEGHHPSSGVPITVRKIVGGGDSWYYALQNGKVLGAAHEDDREAMQRLRDIQKANAGVHAPERSEIA